MKIVKLIKKAFFCSSVLVLGIVSCEMTFHLYRLVRLYVSSNEDNIIFYVLGGSTAYGEPYDNRPNFALLISDYLEEKYNNRNIKINMIASPGKTLKSNLYDFKKSIMLNPQKHAIVLAYTGINESLTRLYKEENDFEYVLKRTIVGTILFRMIDLAGDFLDGGNSLFRYKNGLQDIAYWSRYAGHPVYLSELAGNFHDYAPEFHSNISPDELKDIINCEKVEDSSSRSVCRKEIVDRINFTPYAFMIAHDKYKSNPSAENLKRLGQFYRYDYSDRPIPKKNAIIRQIAFDNDNVTLIPILDAFRGVDNGYIGYNLFEDAHHPNIMGMRIIANQFLKSMTFDGDAEVHPLSNIEKKYDLRQRSGEIIWSRVKWFFFQIVNSSSYRIMNSYRLSQLIDIYSRNHDAIRGTVARYLFYPLLPLYSEVDIWQEFKKYKNERDKIESILQDFLLFNPVFSTLYVRYLDRAHKAEFLSEKNYQQYLGMITEKISINSAHFHEK